MANADEQQAGTRAESRFDTSESHAGAQHFVETLARVGEIPFASPEVLVAGSGDGEEARYIHRALGTSVTGVDPTVSDRPQDAGGDGLRFMAGDVLDLPFDDASFDLVFYHHVIEHVAQPERSVVELARVLRPGGFLYLGTPNRERAVGYIGSRGVPLRTKLAWNVSDYRQRLRGTFRNELGAHAGFTAKELTAMLERHFADTQILTRDYLLFKHGGRLPPSVLSVLTRPPLIRFAAPAIYLLSRR